MKLIYGILALMILIGCETPGQSSSSSDAAPTPPPRIILLGDTNVASAAGFATTLGNELGFEVRNYSKVWDGTNGAMMQGWQDISQFSSDVRANDLVVLMVGMYDSKYYGASDIMNQAKNYHRTLMQQLVARKAFVFVATVPRLPAAGYATAAPLQNGSDAASDFYSNIVRSVAAEMDQRYVKVIDLNMHFPAHSDYFESNGYIFNLNGHNLLAQMFINDMR